MTKRVLLTGGAGFVGSHAVRHFLTNTDWHLILPVSFRHKGLPFRIQSAIEGLDGNRVTVVMTDLSAPIDGYTRSVIGPVDYIVNFASESHVDRSITEPVPFIRNNVDVMLNLLEYARKVKPEMFIQISTDEVYGPAPDGYAHKEWDTFIPSNPYSASKAAQESIAISYWRTYDVPVVLTNTMNMIGEMQDPEKFVPMVIQKALRGEEIPIHAAPGGRVGSRFYLHARNLADACLFLLKNTAPQMYRHGADRPDKWHIVGEREIDNLSMAQLIGKILYDEAGVGQITVNLVDFHTSRPGHDLRYALDGSKIAELGWTPPVPLEDSLRKTIQWSLQNEMWAVNAMALDRSADSR